MTVLALKLLLAPGFIVVTSLVSRRFGVAVAGVVGGLPAIAGPILLVLAIDHGAGFARTAAIGTLLGMVALIVFVLAYAWVCQLARWPWALAAGWGSFLSFCESAGPHLVAFGDRPPHCRGRLESVQHRDPGQRPTPQNSRRSRIHLAFLPGAAGRRRVCGG